MIALEWYVHAEAGFSEIEWDDGAGGTGTAVVSGYYTFRDWLAEIEAALQADGVDYEVAYSDATNRVVFTKNSGANYGLTFQTESMAALLGAASASAFATPASSHIGTLDPGGIVPVLGWAFEGATPAKTIERQDFGNGRARNIAFGSGTIFDLSLIVSAASLRIWHEGPCGTGRVRLGPLDASAPFSSADLDGYLDGTWRALERGRPLDTIAQRYEVSCSVHVTPAPSSSIPSDFDPVYGLLARGFHWGLWARIEGIPYTFADRALGSGTVSQPESERLVLSERTQILWRIDRDRGHTSGSQLRLGIYDPDNALSLFGPAAVQTEITADVAHDDTTINIASSTGLATPVYIGVECVAFAGATATSLTSCTRGIGGSAYGYRVTAPLGWGVVADRPQQWAGRRVALWAQICDPYGAPVANVQTQLYAGEVTAPPVYDSGAWWLDCESLFLRLTRPVGAPSTGNTVTAGLYVGDALGPVVGIEKDAELQVYIADGGSAEFSASYAMSAILTGIEHTTTDRYFVPWAAILNAAISKASTDWSAEFASSDKIFPIFLAMARQESGAWSVEMRASKTGVFPGDGRWVFGPVVNADGSLWSGWTKAIDFQKATLQKVSAPGGGLQQWRGLYEPGLAGDSIDSAVLTVGGELDALASADAWASADGVVVIEGTDAQEIAEYAELAQANGRVYIGGLTRGVSNTPRQDVLVSDVEVSQYVSLDGSAGTQLATALESSGYGDRGTYDTLPFGYALPSTVLDEPGLAGNQSGLLVPASALAPGTSIVEHLGGALASQGYAIAPVRKGNGALRIGIRGIDPFGTTQNVLTDADLRLDRGPILRELHPAPNVVRLEPASLGGIEYATTRVIHKEAKDAEGIREVVYTLPATTSALASALLRAWALQALASRRGCVIYEMSVTPARDWLPGQLVAIDTAHAALRRSDGTAGLEGVGVVLEVSRGLDYQCRISVLVRTDDLDVAPLCPASRVTAVSGSTVTVEATTFPDGSTLFAGGEPIYLWQSGVSGNYTAGTISSISGLVLTLSSVPGWLTSGAVATGLVWAGYPAEASANARQDAYTHIADGTEWQ